MSPRDIHKQILKEREEDQKVYKARSRLRAWISWFFALVASMFGC